MMKKASILKFLNPLLFLAAFIQIITVVIIKTIPTSQIFTIHEYNGYTLAVIILLHLILNWNWIRLTYFKQKK
jgi:hypothetical protein